jgi:hypothetical protein
MKSNAFGLPHTEAYREHPPITQVLGLTQHHDCGWQSLVFAGHASPFFFLIAAGGFD